MKRFSPIVRFRVDGLHDSEAWYAALTRAGKFGSIPVPDVAVRQAAMSGFDLRGYKVLDLIIDTERQAVHLHLQKPLPTDGESFLLPVIHYTDENFHPVHGPSGHWWEAMEACRYDSAGTYLSEPLIAEIKGALGGLDLTGVFIQHISNSATGYQIRVAVDAFGAVPNV